MIDDKKLDKLIQEKIDNIDEVAVLSGMMTVLTVTSFIGMLNSFYKTFVSKKERECKSYTGSAKTICNLNFMIKANKAGITKANSLRSECMRNAKDREKQNKCREKFDAKILNYKNKNIAMKNKLNELKDYNII